jgi:hypothetical protein
MGITVTNRIFHSLLFADDQMIFAQDEDDMKYMKKKVRGMKIGS